ncbi:MAG TPA: ABC transporter permease [Thermoanaerobaculia bacterium]|nr:ABC transporter permease [Thermoanaerobaculia bacterium]
MTTRWTELGREALLAGRRLWRSPGLSLAAVAMLALAIGADTAVFSVVEAVLLRPLPYRDPGRLVALWEDHSPSQGSPRTEVAAATFEDYRRQSRTLRQLSAMLSHGFDLIGAGEPEVLYGSEVSADFFPLLGAAPLFGRVLTAADVRPGAAPSVVLGHELWRRRFGGDRWVLGRVVRLDDLALTVVGVMPPEFSVPLHLRSPGQRAELWLPLRSRASLQNHHDHAYDVVGRLAPGTTLAAAQAETRAIAGRLALEYPRECGGAGATLVPLTEQVAGEARSGLLLLLGAVTFLVLIACGNLAGLLVARSAARQRELSICAALGAGPGRLARQVLSEALLLVLAGGAAGLGLALGVLRLLPALLPPDLPRAGDVRLDGLLLAYALGAAIVSGLLAAALPAWRGARTPLAGALAAAAGRGASAGPSRVRLGDALVAAQIALALLLLGGAGLMLASFARLSGVDPGFRADHALVFEIAPEWRRHPDATARAAFFQEVERRLAALPGVVAVGGITRLPLEPAYGISELIVEGRPVPPQGPPIVGGRGVTPGYFQAMAIPLLAGRQLTDRDDARAPEVGLVNQALAERFLAGGPVVGRRLRDGRDGPWMQVVGVVGDTVFDSLAGAPTPEIFFAAAQGSPGGLTMVVRTTTDPLALAPSVRREVWAMNPNVPVNRLRTLADQVGGALARPRFSLLVVAVFAGLALALAAAGVGALMACTVAQRTREIGIRMALGAGRRDALALVLRRAALMAAAGVAAGLGGGFALMRWLAAQLYQASAAEPLPYLAGAACLLVAALVAAYVPARRAAGVDPVTALRQE